MVKYGTTRMVVLIGDYAIKIPNITNHKHFLKGCCDNWSERSFYKNFRYAYDNPNLHNYACPSYYCSLFGLMQIQARCESLNRMLSTEEIELTKTLHMGDSHDSNFGIYQGRLVVLDYP